MPDVDHWDAEHPAIWQEKVGTGPTARAITLRHPTYPFTADWDPRTGDLIKIAATYLEKVKSMLGLQSVTFQDHTIKTSGILPLTWLAVSNDGTNSRDLSNSVWISRRDPNPPSQIIDRTAILFAVQSLPDQGKPRPIGSRRGIRVVAHVSTGSPTVRITGATCSIELADPVAMSLRPDMAFLPFDFFSEFARDNLRNIVRASAGLGHVRPAIVGLSIRSAADGQSIFEYYMTATRRSHRADAPSEALTFRIRSDQSLDQAVIETFPLFSHCADVTTRLFVQDPASAEGSFTPHPYCGPQLFERFRCDVVLPGLAPGNPTTLRDNLNQVEVMQSRFCGRLTTGVGAPNETQPEAANLGSIPHARTNVFAAASGYQHARNLFDNMRSYGLRPEDYFRLAALPLHVRYRAGVPPGPGKDGNTVNARVDYDAPHADFDAALVDDHLKPLQIRFALADVQRSGSQRQPLGVAADPRWNWHEFGHVLIAAATGALELPFVHSTGDALAAILSDPSSSLSDPAKSKVAPSWRGATFPWVYLNRRHDRSVYDGWSWSGSFHRPARFTSQSAFLRKGYDSEQILSTTLFRLYRSLGGDTFSAPDVRQSAAHYTAYLIMRAIAWLGPINWAPAETPDQFVSALVDADIATAPITANVATAPTPPAFPERVGGCAHKVVRWAFEAQGLYASSNPQDVVNAPGRPPEVDIFIDDRRAAYKPAYAGGPVHAAGSYTPVPLDWMPVPPGSPDAPAWHATEQAIRVDGNGDVWVTVRNRGSMGAADVVIDIWHAAPAAGIAPDWESGEWNHLGTAGPRAVGPGASETFGPVSALPAGRPRFILAATTCPADLANIDPVTGLPCETGRTPIVDLVAGDNNVGLRLLPGP
jgi:hypothetical protein